MGHVFLRDNSSRRSLYRPFFFLCFLRFLHLEFFEQHFFRKWVGGYGEGTGADRLRGYGGALHLVVGLEGLELAVSLVFAVKQGTG